MIWKHFHIIFIGLVAEVHGACAAVGSATSHHRRRRGSASATNIEGEGVHHQQVKRLMPFPSGGRFFRHFGIGVEPGNLLCCTMTNRSATDGSSAGDKARRPLDPGTGWRRGPPPTGSMTRPTQQQPVRDEDGGEKRMCSSSSSTPKDAGPSPSFFCDYRTSLGAQLPTAAASVDSQGVPNCC